MKEHSLSDKWADLGIINIDGLKPKYIWTLGYNLNIVHSKVLCMFRCVENQRHEIFHRTSKIPLDVENSNAP